MAVPVECRVTGMMIGIVNRESIARRNDMSRDTRDTAKQIERYNPDRIWRRTEVSQWALVPWRLVSVLETTS